MDVLIPQYCGNSCCRNIKTGWTIINCTDFLRSYNIKPIGKGVDYSAKYMNQEKR